MAAIAIKMMLLYGITYRELRKIKWSDYEDRYGFIKINEFDVRLPKKLSVQLALMKDFVYQQTISNKEGLMFTDILGQPWADTTSYSGIPDYLGTLLGITSVSRIVKYGISQLLKAGLSDSIIKKMTGASDKLIQGCLLHEDEELNRLINNKLVTVDFYYQF